MPKQVAFLVFDTSAHAERLAGLFVGQTRREAIENCIKQESEIGSQYVAWGPVEYFDCDVETGKLIEPEEPIKPAKRFMVCSWAPDFEIICGVETYDEAVQYIKDQRGDFGDYAVILEAGLVTMEDLPE